MNRKILPVFSVIAKWMIQGLKPVTLIAGVHACMILLAGCGRSESNSTPASRDVSGVVKNSPVTGNEATQGVWKIVGRLEAGEWRDLHFINKDQGWAVGGSGAIMHTANGGKSWDRQESPTPNDLVCVCFVNGKTGWASGASSTLLATVDGGVTWTTQQRGENRKRIFMALCFLNDQQGWAVDNLGDIVHTKDGGAHWLPQSSGLSSALVSVRFLNANEGWAVAINSTLLHTVDGGNHWEVRTLKIDSPRHPVVLNDLFFADSRSAWITSNTSYSSQDGEGSPVLHTGDGGLTWTTIGLAPESMGRAVHFMDATHGWLVGVQGIYYSKDGGRTWLKQLASAGDAFQDICFVDDSHGWVLTWTGTVYQYQNP